MFSSQSLKPTNTIVVAENKIMVNAHRHTQILPLSVAQQIEPACSHFLHKPEKRNKLVTQGKDLQIWLQAKEQGKEEKECRKRNNVSIYYERTGRKSGWVGEYKSKYILLHPHGKLFFFFLVKRQTEYLGSSWACFYSCFHF